MVHYDAPRSGRAGRARLSRRVRSAVAPPGARCGARDDDRRPGTSGPGGSTSSWGTPRRRSTTTSSVRRHSRASSVGVGRAAAVLREPGAEDVGHVHDRGLFADGAVLGQRRPRRCAPPAAARGARRTRRGGTGGPFLNSLTTALRARRYSTRPPVPGDGKPSQGRRPEAHRHKGTVGATRTAREFLVFRRASRPVRRLAGGPVAPARRRRPDAGPAGSRSPRRPAPGSPPLRAGPTRLRGRCTGAPPGDVPPGQ